jgi:hypothetical protein
VEEDPEVGGPLVGGRVRMPPARLCSVEAGTMDKPGADASIVLRVRFSGHEAMEAIAADVAVGVCGILAGANRLARDVDVGGASEGSPDMSFSGTVVLAASLWKDGSIEDGERTLPPKRALDAATSTNFRGSGSDGALADVCKEF